jgi:TRAP transporter TAXI family solute receptor
MGRYKIRELNPKVFLVLFFPILLILAAILWVSSHFLQPVPPRTLVMTTGMEGGAFIFLGERYRQVLARNGIRLQLIPSSGSVENLKRLADETQIVDVGFAQGGITKIEETLNLVSLGSVFYTPLWVFYRSDETLDDLSRLRGKRIAIGPEGSGVRKFSLDLLKSAGISGPPTILYELPNPDAGKAIMEGKVDAAMMFGSSDSTLVLQLIRAQDIKLMSFSQAEAYTRLFPDLSHVFLPRGIFDLSGGFPSSDVHLLAPTANLVVRKSLHPAMVYLLLKAAVEIHSGAGWVHRAGEFPSLKTQDFPISEQARRFYRAGGSLLYDYLPFWVATFIDRIILILIPLGVILIPLIGVMPWAYTWWNRSKYYPWYRELRILEKELTERQQPETVKDYYTRLDRIDEAVGGIRVSVAFYDEVFLLKQHIQLVRKKLIHLNQSLLEPSDKSRDLFVDSHGSSLGDDGAT